MYNDTAKNLHLIPLELTDELNQAGIITKLVKDTRTNSVVISLNHIYKQKTLIFPLPPARKIDWVATIEKIAKSLRASGVSPDHILMIEDALHTNYERVIWGVDNSHQEHIRDKQKESYFIRKYTANGLLPLHESVVFADSGQVAFVYLDGDDGKSRIVNYIERCGKTLYPADDLDSQNPLPYTFASIKELETYIELAKRETLDSLYQNVKSNLQRYVNIDEHYLIVIASDIILSYFQDKFATLHYDIFVGDNGSGKNSALLAISRLAYRVFYLVSASAPNYFTFYGNVEEGQGTIAEDEVGDLDKDYQKQKILKSGYTSGGTVPKIDFPNGKRSQAPFNVYGMKWFAMEERPDSRKTKGIFDRSFIFNFIVGHVDYNIKDVIKNAGDPKFKPLYDELVHVHKLLFAFRLIHYNDVFPDIQINLENRNAELTKPSLRLFSSLGDAPVAVEEIKLALSKFIVEKNELKSNSIESKLCSAIIELIRERNENPNSQDYEGLEDYAFTNEQIWAKCRIVMDGIDILGKSESFYSIDDGKITHRKISSLFQSKFKAVPFKTSGDNSKRGWRFQIDVIDRIALQYTNEIKEIIILNGTARPEKEKTASDASDASHYKSQGEGFSENIASSPAQNPVQNPSSEPVVEQLINNRNLDHENIDTISNTNTNDNDNDNDNDSNTTTIPTNKYNNNYNVTDINRSDNSGANLTNSRISMPVTCNRQTNQIKLYSNIPCRPLKCDASDASDAPYRKGNQIGKTKAEQVGFPDMPCLYCAYKDPLDFDLSLHYIEKHRQDLIRLPMGKGSIDDRADYAVKLSKRKLFETLDEDDEDDNRGDEEGDDEGDE
jgi:hypothetical protein